MSRWKAIYPQEIGKTKKDMGIIKGVYVIYVLDKVVYVGQSENILQRLRGHGLGRASEDPNDFFVKYAVPLKVFIKFRKEKFGYERLAAEQRLMDVLRPRLNHLSLIDCEPRTREFEEAVERAALAFSFSAPEPVELIANEQ